MLEYDGYGDGPEGSGDGNGTGYSDEVPANRVAGDGYTVNKGSGYGNDYRHWSGKGEGYGLGAYCWVAVTMNVSFETDVYFILFTRGKNHGV